MLSLSEDLHNSTLECVYIVSEKISENLQQLLKLNDKIVIPQKFKKYIEKLILLVKEEQHGKILKIKPLEPILTRDGKYIKIGKGISYLPDTDYDEKESIFGELSFGEKRSIDNNKITIEFSSEVAREQLSKSTLQFRSFTTSIGNIYVIVRTKDALGNIILSFHVLPSETGLQSTLNVKSEIVPIKIENSEGWQEYKDDIGRTYYHNPTTGVSVWEKPFGMKKYYHKYLKYKQKYIEIQSNRQELEGGFIGDRTYVFCPLDVSVVVKKFIPKTFSDKEFFLFLIGPRSYYTEGKSKKICSLWYDFVDNTFWSDGLGLHQAKTQIDSKIKEENSQKIKGKDDIEHDVSIKGYAFFYFKSVMGGYNLDYEGLVK